MFRFYRGALALGLITIAASASAQSTPLPEQPLLGSTFTAAVLRDLPVSNNVLAIPETLQLETISDLFSAGGLNSATAPKIGGLLNSWTQTQYRIGDVSITDPRAGGTPLLLPFLPLWDRVTTMTGAMGIDEGASGVSMTLEPPRPGTSWFRAVEGTFSGSGLVAGVAGSVPAIDRISGWQDASAIVSGPLTDRVGLAAAGSWRGLSHVAAPSVTATDDHAASGFAHLVFAATPRDEIRALGWVQQAATAARTDNSVHVQGTWERHDPASLSWRLFGGYTSRDRSATVPSMLVVDSLNTDPVSDLVDNGSDTTRRWAVGARITPAKERRLPTAGVDVDGAEVRIAPNGIAFINESVNGVPARAWAYLQSSAPDVRQWTTIGAFVNEHVALGPVTVDAGVRLESLHGDANGAARGISWTSWLPRAMARWDIVDKGRIAVVGSYRRSAYQPTLNLLAVGDPAAPVADVSRWNGTAIGPMIARIGPGTAGDAGFSQIDPNLQRPTTDELVLAVQARPRPGLLFQLSRITKREQPLLGFIDTGVTAADYSSIQVQDPSFIPTSPVGAAQVDVLNRPAGAYGRDRYLLTNQTGDPVKSWALELDVQAQTEHLTLLAGVGLTEATGPAAAVGFLPAENDQDVLGNAFVDPNSATHAVGQLFQDRSHIGKIAAIYQLPWQLRIGAILRYADGQPFTRVVVAPTLTQGATAVRSYANGGSAFTYVGTLDLRLQKMFTVGATKLSAILEVYNLPNLANEVTEYIVSGPAFRTPTALQPPRTALIGLRVAF